MTPDSMPRKVLPPQAKDCFEYYDGTGLKIGGSQLQQWAGCKFGHKLFRQFFVRFWFPPKCQWWVSIWTVVEILGDPYFKKYPLPRIGVTLCLSVTPSIPSHRILGKSQILNRISTSYNYPRRAQLE
jgi:hypothetical protein